MSAFIATLNVSKTQDEKIFFKSQLKQYFQLLLILEFIVNLYSFPLVVEILLLPMVTLITAMLAISKSDKSFESVANILSKVLGFIGVLILFYAMIEIMINSNIFFSYETFQDFLTPIVLSFGYIPFLFIVFLMMKYEEGFTRLEYHIKDTKLQKITKLRALNKFHMNISQFYRWLNILNYIQVKSIDDIKLSFDQLDEMVKREKEPRYIKQAEGWSPCDAKEFLSRSNLILNDFHPSSDGEWCSSSPYLDFGDGLLKDNIAFYASGSVDVVQKLKVVLNNNNSDIGAVNKFVLVARELFKESIGKEMSSPIENAIRNLDNAKFIIDNKEVTVETQSWLKGIAHGYNLNFIIEVKRGLTNESD